MLLGYDDAYEIVFLKVTAVKAALSSVSQGQKSDSVLAKPLKSQAFASPAKVAEVVQKVKLRLICFCSIFFVFFFCFTTRLTV